MSMTKKKKKQIGVIAAVLLAAVVIGAVAMFAFRGGVGDTMTQYGEFSNRTVFPQGDSMLSDDGIIRLNGGIQNKVDIILNAPADGVYKLYLDNHKLTSNEYPYVFVASSAWNEGETFVSNFEDGAKYDAQGYSERGLTVYLNEGRNVVSIWLMNGNTMQITGLKYKLYNLDADIKIDKVTYTKGYTGSATTGSLEGKETYLLRSGDKATSTFKVTDSGVYSVAVFSTFNDGDSKISIKIKDDTGAVVGSFDTTEFKDYLVINRQHDGSSCCCLLDFGDDFEVELELGTYTIEVTTSNWVTYGGAILDRVGPLGVEE